MLEAIAIFLTLLTVICGIVTYISAHNNPLNIPDISKGGSIATVILLISAIVTGLWPSSSMYRDCGDLTETALDHRRDLLAYELVSTGGAVDALRQEPRDEILSFFRDNESCFEIPRELAVYRVAFTDELEEADRQRAIDVLGRNGEHLRRFALVVHPDYSVDQNWRSILSIYIDQWAVLPRSMAAPMRRALGALTEMSCLKLHGLMLSTRPGLLYWNPATVAAMQAVRALRSEGVPVYFTIDAGPQVKAICEPEHAATVEQALATVPGVLDTRRSALGPAAYVLD